LIPRLRLSLALAAAVVAGHAHAQEWVSYGESEIGVHYYDRASVRATGERKRVWRLIERREALSNGIRSGKALIEIDCREGTYRYLKTMHYAGSMGRGRFIGGSGQQPREFVAPGTMAAQLSKAVC